MADTLKARLLDSDRRGDVVNDLQTLVDQEVAARSIENVLIAEPEPELPAEL